MKLHILHFRNSCSWSKGFFFFLIPRNIDRISLKWVTERDKNTRQWSLEAGKEKFRMQTGRKSYNKTAAGKPCSPASRHENKETEQIEGPKLQSRRLKSCLMLLLLFLILKRTGIITKSSQPFIPLFFILLYWARYFSLCLSNFQATVTMSRVWEPLSRKLIPLYRRIYHRFSFKKQATFVP